MLINLIPKPKTTHYEHAPTQDHKIHYQQGIAKP